MTEPTADDLRTLYGARIEAEITELRATSERTREDRKPVELDQQAVGRLSRMDAIQQQAMAQAKDARRQGRIRALETALTRLAGTEFGWCQDCGDFIGLRRLDLDPTATRCVECAR